MAKLLSLETKNLDRLLENVQKAVRITKVFQLIKACDKKMRET